jgi:hypothetical protein
MKAEELRKGNIISDGYFEIEVTEISERIIKGKTQGLNAEYSFNIDNLCGILLTQEWLLKLGFKRAKKRDLYPESYLMENVLKSTLYLRPSYQGGYYWGFINTDSIIEPKTDHEFYDARPYQYVHQFQNLYFALTGEELELK